MIIVYLVMALLGSMATIFALQNREPVEIWFLTWSLTGIPLALVILLSLLLGVVIASLSGLVKVVKLRYRVRQLEAEVSRLVATRTSSSSPPAAPGPSLPV